MKNQNSLISLAYIKVSDNPLRVFCNYILFLLMKEPKKELRADILKEKLLLFNTSLKKDFGIAAPKIAVFALNPHAGDNGLIGKEEIEVIKPVLEELKAENIL